LPYYKTNLSGHNKIWRAQKIEGHCPQIPPVATGLFQHNPIPVKAAQRKYLEMKRNNNVKHFVVSLTKYGLQGTFCWFWHHAIDQVV